MSEKINVSFSGGKTSGFMCYILKTHPKYKDNEYTFTFANTGQEHPKTLEFVDRCDKYFNLNLNWVEAVVHHGERKGCTHKLVNYKNCSKKGEVFEEVIKKYGLPNIAFKLCNRELKTNPMRSFRKSIGWNDYRTAIGIRYDEPKRVKKLFYPLFELKLDKVDVNSFWEDQPFNLEIEPHQGNCTWCIEKSIKKLALVYKQNPEFFEFPKRMELQHKNTGPTPDGLPRKIFRGQLSVDDIVRISSENHHLEKYVNLFDDENSGCSESCEVEFDQ